MKAVIQAEKTGCGIASVAALAGVSYISAKAAANSLGISAEDPRLWSDTAPVRRLLTHYGLRAGTKEIPFDSWEKLPDRALLAIKWHLESGKPFWHWVVFARIRGESFVLDPKKALVMNRRTDFGRMKPRWFIRVQIRR